MEVGRKTRKAGSRSETVSVRLEPRLRYLAELAARKQRRTLSSFVEWLVEESLDRVSLDPQNQRTVRQDAESLWDVNPADRFAKLALKYEHLLNHEEQYKWKLIKECGQLWMGNRVNRIWRWTVKPESLIFERLREHWDAFERVARGEASPDILPK